MDAVQDRESLLERLNQAVRLPEDFGGLPTVVRLLDRLAAVQPSRGDHVWIPDTNGRLAPSAMLRQSFPDAEVHVVASQYGEDAHRRGWLRLDRTLTPAEHSVVVDTAVVWSRNNRSLQEVVDEFGPPSVIFGSTDPDRPKTISYTTSDPAAPVVAFHLGFAPPEADTGSDEGPSTSPVLLAVRVHDGFVGGWEVTPLGESRFG